MHELYNTLYSSKVKLNIKKSLNYLQLSNVESQLLATMIIFLSVHLPDGFASVLPGGANTWYGSVVVMEMKEDRDGEKRQDDDENCLL